MGHVHIAYDASQFFSSCTVVTIFLLFHVQIFSLINVWSIPLWILMLMLMMIQMSIIVGLLSNSLLEHEAA